MAAAAEKLKRLTIGDRIVECRFEHAPISGH